MLLQKEEASGTSSHLKGIGCVKQEFEVSESAWGFLERWTGEAFEREGVQ